MIKRNSHWVSLGLFLLPLLLAPQQAVSAQDGYPNKPIRLILGVAPGGAMETAARQWMPYLEKDLGVPIRLDSIPGAEGIIANRTAAAAEPDGYTFVQMPLSFLPAQTLIFKAPYDFNAFEIISNYITDPMVIMVHKDSQWKTLKELIAYAKSKPEGTLNFGQSSLTAPAALVLHALEEAVGIKLNIVSFNGGGPSRLALAGRHTDASLTGLFASASISEFVRVLGVAQEKNLWEKESKNAPTLNKELGITIPQAADTISLFAPAGFSKRYPERAKKFSTAFFRVFENPSYRAAIQKLGDAGRVLPRTAEESQRLLLADYELYKQYAHLFKDYKLQKK